MSELLDAHSSISAIPLYYIQWWHLEPPVCFKKTAENSCLHFVRFLISLRSNDYVSTSLQRFLLFSNAGRAQRRYLAGTLRVETTSRLSGSSLTSKTNKSLHSRAHSPGYRVVRHASGFLKAEGAFSVIRQKLIRLLRCNFLYSPKAHTIIALPFPVR